MAGPPSRQLNVEPPGLDLFREEMASSFADTSGLEGLAKRAEAGLDASALVLDANGKMSRIPSPLDKTKLCEEFGLQARDLRQLDGNVIELSPVILVRKRSILYSSSLMRVLIATDRIVFLDEPHPPDANVNGSMPDRRNTAEIAKAVALYLRVLDAGAPRSTLEAEKLIGRVGTSTPPPVAFEHRALEALLLLITRGYRRAFNKLQSSSLEIVDGLRADISSAEIRALTDTSRVVEDFLGRATAFQQTLASCLHEDDDDLSSMYLSAAAQGKPRVKDDHAEVELLLESMLQRADETVQSAQQLSLRLKNANEHMVLSLSSTRNRLLLMEIRIALLMLAITAGMTLPGLYGANLHNQFEDVAYGLYILWACSAVIALWVAKMGFKALSHSRRSQLSLPSGRSEGTEGRRRYEVARRRQAQAQAARQARTNSS